MALGRRDAERADQEPAELAALADGSLAAERRAGLEDRVASSPELGSRLAEQERAIDVVQRAVAEVEAPAALRARIERERSARRRPVPRRTLLAGAVAAVAAAVVVGVAVYQTTDSSAERLHAALGPTSLVPAATGEATLTRTTSGWRIELTATGLPRLDGGRFYEAWLRNAEGVIVPIGTFNEGRSVTLWAGVSPKEFSTLTVTRERADDDQRSSGEKVLVGSVADGD